MVNWCWGEWGLDFKKLKNKLKKLPFVDPKKLDSLYVDIEAMACYPHDRAFDKGGGIRDFIKANYEFANKVLELLHWTSPWGRTTILVFVFWSMNIFGIKYFNWNFKK